MRRVSANKNVLSSRLYSVRQMSCCRSSAGRLFHSRGPATPIPKTSIAEPWLCSGDRTCVDISWYADVLRPWRVGSRRIGTAGRGGGATCTPAPWCTAYVRLIYFAFGQYTSLGDWSISQEVVYVEYEEKGMTQRLWRNRRENNARGYTLDLPQSKVFLVISLFLVTLCVPGVRFSH